ncbi:MAG: DUF1735 and LamG domain-containing protein [Muribaculaceae bacterium]|nr:DUF1735 and LamG domain-containing protein [Muribaculaceae bacterium]
MKFYSYITAAMLVAGLSFTACSDDNENPDNRVMDNDALKPSSVLIDGMTETSTQTFNLTMAFPVTEKVDVVYGVDESLLEAYNTVYKENAVLLPTDNYDIVEPTATFAPGAVTSSDVTVDITNLNTLDRNIVYVLPLIVKSSTVPVLDSQRVRYIVVRGAALINVVVDMAHTGAILYNSVAATQLAGLTELTVQMLLNVNEFGGSEAGIQTLLGIEGMFLLRLGDSEPVDHIQLATLLGNISDDSWTFKAKEWTRLAFTFNTATGEATVFINGARKATKVSSYKMPVNWTAGFAIGQSYSMNRWLNGYLSEVRIWNRILSDTELANEEQAYVVDPQSEGLVSYWKFNDGSGSMIHDYTNGYDLLMVPAPNWVQVSLPE